MALLHNRVSNKELKDRLMNESFKRTTISFYRYLPIENPQHFRDDLYKLFNAIQVFGRIYIAKEGINAQLSVPEHHLAEFKNILHNYKGLEDLRLNVAVEDPNGLNDEFKQGKSFWVLKIKVRDKIVADGIEDPDFSMDKKGKYLNAAQMNEMLNDANTIVVDMRNHYEFEVGHFENAIEIPSDTFRDQLPMAIDMLKGKEDKNIIMYCTGGIRCEKASAYMLHQGFENVYHLEGGIIHYSKEIKEQHLPAKFIGKNFVFDDRLGERITEDIIALCHQCGKPCDTHTNCKNDGCHLLFIQCADCATQFNGCCSIECVETIHLPKERQEAIRKGIDKGQNIFNKSSARLRPKLPDLLKTGDRSTS
ncbi:MAG: rhodanese-related sulfurtransferase [Sphingobacteriia bacterium]|nr:MAG: rhodanese-related sulfurtransferase [Sphingobacteriia bacterium]